MIRAIAASILVLALSGQDSAKAPEPRVPVATGTDADFLGPFAQEIYFAVLEGLYEDGVSNDVVERIVRIDERSNYPANFVWSCPACMPAYNAFLAYKARPAFQGLKVRTDTFGPGLVPEVVARVSAVDDTVRQAAIEELVRGWIERRMKLLRLTDAERAEWRLDMEKRRKQGMGFLESYRNAGLGGTYASMKTCPICEGANGACGPR